MHQAIVHIGTEKTGSTAIQNFLYKNEVLLKKHRVLYPYRTCGLISNFRMVIQSLNESDPLLVAMDLRAKNSTEYTSYGNDPEQWRKEFNEEHHKEIQKFQNRRTQSTVVYSSEHFHSRIEHEEEIIRLREFLDYYYDQVRIVSYLRRQDRLAISGHNTSIQGGAVNDFDFASIDGKTKYFDYLTMLTRWSKVFGSDNVVAKIYERNRLTDQDVGKDFKATILPPDISKKFDKKKSVHYERSNPRLSFSALQALVAFNRKHSGDAEFNGVEKERLRQPLITALHSLRDDFGEVLPARKTAEAFYERFRKDNQQVFEQWGDGQTFNEDFSMFPTEADSIPAVDANALLSQYLKPVISAL